MIKIKEERKAFWHLMAIIIVVIIIATGLKIRFWQADGNFEVTRDTNTVVAYVRDSEDPIKTFTIFATGHSQDLVAYFPKYIPWEGQSVHLFRFYMETKTKTWPQISWVIPKQLVITKVIGKLDYTIDEGDRTDWIGFVRNGSDKRYTITIDKNIPHYRTISFGILPEIGDIVRFWYIEFFFSKEKFFNLAILY